MANPGSDGKAIDRPMTIRSFFARDFVETGEGIAYALLADAPEDGRLPVMPRYRRAGSGWSKLEGDSLRDWFDVAVPGRVRHCPRRACLLASVDPDEVTVHHEPRRRWRELVAERSVTSLPERLQRALTRLVSVFRERGIATERIGLTGSLLIGAASDASDLDLVAYGSDVFDRVRAAFVAAVENGALNRLSADDWERAWRRRGTSLTLDEYLRHEPRKGVNVLAEGVKCDLGLVVPQNPPVPAVKLGRRRIVARIVDDRHAFERPARWTLAGPIPELVVNTATFVGQARRGECIEAVGMVERCLDGSVRLVLGGSREAREDRLVVLDEADDASPCSAASPRAG